MKTDELIAALAVDARPAPAPMRQRLAWATLGGIAVSAVVFQATLGIRPDIGAALGTWRFDVKVALTLLALGLGFYECLRLANPLARGWVSAPSGALPLALAAAVGAELLLAPAGTWSARLVGTNWLVCLVAIPALSLAPLMTGLYAMRAGAPSSPRAAGLALGRLAAAAAAVMYALHCVDDSPLFVAVWYTLATLLVAALGAACGARLLRW